MEVFSRKAVRLNYPEQQQPSTPSPKTKELAFGDGDASSSGGSQQHRIAVDKLFAQDKVAKFDSQGELICGRVVIDSKELEARIEWDDGEDEILNKNSGGQVILKSKVGLLDRKSVGKGIKVTDGKRNGTVQDKRFLITASVKDSPDIIIDEIRAETLIRPKHSKKDVKIVYKDWVGLIVDTKGKIYFQMEKDGKIGSVSDESFGKKFPNPGEKIQKMPISLLWDADWGASDYWLWNFFKYLTNPATILRIDIDRMNIAWMGRISNNSNALNEDEETPNNELKGPEAISQVQYLYGRNWKYMQDVDTWQYIVRDQDKPISYDKWTKEISNRCFFGLIDNSIDIDVPEDKESLGLEDSLDYGKQGNQLLLLPGNTIYIKILLWRSVVDVDWDDGTSETLPIYSVRPNPKSVIPQPNETLFVGDLVRDKNDIYSPKKYGFIEKITSNGIVTVKWILPNSSGDPTLTLGIVSKFDVSLHPQYTYLRSIFDLPVVVSTKKTNSFQEQEEDRIRVGIAVGTSVKEAKIIIRCTDEIERLVWAHDFKHFKGDIVHDVNSKWIPWTFPSNFQDDNDSCVESILYPNQIVLSPISGQSLNNIRPAFQLVDTYPSDHMYVSTEFIPRLNDAKFQISIQREIEFLKNETPSGVWIEAYSHRADLFTVLIQGTKNTPFEDHLLIFDFGFPHDFPNSAPLVCINLLSDKPNNVIISPFFDEDDGHLILPEELESGNDKESSLILKIVEYIKDQILVSQPLFTGMTPEEISETSEDYEWSVRELEYRNYVILNMLEYTDSFLNDPLYGWESFAQSYFSLNLAKIVSRYENLLAQVKQNEAGDQKDTDYIPCNGFILGLQSRLEKLKDFLQNENVESVGSTEELGQEGLTNNGDTFMEQFEIDPSCNPANY